MTDCVMKGNLSSGRMQLFALHLPLGLALLGGLVPLVVSSAKGHPMLAHESG